MKISVEQLDLAYGRDRVLENLTFQVGAGSVYSLLGRNGAGKSSLIKVLLGQRRADAGQVTLLGLDPWRDRCALMARVGATPEIPDAPPAMSVARVEESVAPLYSHWDHAGFNARLERFGIDRRSRFGDLSRGQKSLVMLSLAVAQAPELLILDDPTLGLDAVARRFLYGELIAEIVERGTTVLLATHDLAGVEHIATHVGILAAGRLVADGPVESIRDDAGVEDAFVRLAGEAEGTP